MEQPCLVGLLPGLYSAADLVQPKSTFSGMVLPKLDRLFHINYQSRNFHTGMLQGQSDGDMPKCIKSTTKMSHGTIIYGYHT